MADFNIYEPLVFDAEGRKYENLSIDQCNKFGLEVDDINEYYQITTATCKDVAALDELTASRIMKKLYWDRYQADLINHQELAMFLVDSGLNQGRTFIAKAIQNFLNVIPTGNVFTLTIGAINNCDPFELYCKLYGYRRRKYEGICEADASKLPEQQGWFNRLDDFKVTRIAA